MSPAIWKKANAVLGPHIPGEWWGSISTWLNYIDQCEKNPALRRTARRSRSERVYWL